MDRFGSSVTVASGADFDLHLGHLRTIVHQLFHARRTEKIGADRGKRMSAVLLRMRGQPAAFLQAVVADVHDHPQ